MAPRRTTTTLASKTAECKKTKRAEMNAQKAAKVKAEWEAKRRNATAAETNHVGNAASIITTVSRKITQTETNAQKKAKVKAAWEAKRRSATHLDQPRVQASTGTATTITRLTAAEKKAKVKAEWDEKRRSAAKPKNHHDDEDYAATKRLTRSYTRSKSNSNTKNLLAVSPVTRSKMQVDPRDSLPTCTAIPVPVDSDEDFFDLVPVIPVPELALDTKPPGKMVLMAAGLAVMGAVAVSCHDRSSVVDMTSAQLENLIVPSFMQQQQPAVVVSTGLSVTMVKPLDFVTELVSVPQPEVSSMPLEVEDLVELTNVPETVDFESLPDAATIPKVENMPSARPLAETSSSWGLLKSIGWFSLRVLFFGCFCLLKLLATLAGMHGTSWQLAVGGILALYSYKVAARKWAMEAFDKNMDKCRELVCNVLSREPSKFYSAVELVDKFVRSQRTSRVVCQKAMVYVLSKQLRADKRVKAFCCVENGQRVLKFQWVGA